MIYDNTKVKPCFTNYLDNKRIALALNDETGSLYTVLTVNIDEPITNDKCAYIDTNNCGDKAVDWIIKNKLGKLTGRMGFSGFCIYPEVEFNQDKIDKYVAEM